MPVDVAFASLAASNNRDEELVIQAAEWMRYLCWWQLMLSADVKKSFKMKNKSPQAMMPLWFDEPKPRKQPRFSPEEAVAIFEKLAKSREDGEERN